MRRAEMIGVQVFLIAALLSPSSSASRARLATSIEDQQTLQTLQQQQQPQQLQHNVRQRKSYDKMPDVTQQQPQLQQQQEQQQEPQQRRELEDAETSVDKWRTRHRRELSDYLIAPNTRWCGRGNTANTYNQLGGASAADKCCRKHDHCQLYITAMSTRFELFNYRPYTLSHCSCDRRFRTCLKMASDDDANTIGKLFFNMVQTQCFVLRNERVCQRRAGDGTCEQIQVKQKAYLKNNKKF